MDFFQTNCLNGELYIHGEHLQDIQSAVKKPNKLSPKLQFHIFELPTINQPYSAKSTLFGQLNAALNLSHVIGITPILVESHDEATHWYDIHLTSGFEGSVIYNSDAMYEFNVRSSSVLKYKGTLDLEVKLLSYNVDKNGHPVFNAIYNGKEFKVKPKGTDKERKDPEIVMRACKLGCDELYERGYIHVDSDGYIRAGEKARRETVLNSDLQDIISSLDGKKFNSFNKEKNGKYFEWKRKNTF